MKPRDLAEGTESPTAKPDSESPAIEESLMEEGANRENLEEALQRVRANKGSPGVDGRTIERTRVYLCGEHWPTIRDQLLSGTYRPQPVRRVEIPKPDGGVRKLGVPTVAGPADPAGDPAGAARRLGPDVLRAQLRLPPGALGPPGGGPAQELPRRRLRLGGGHRSGEVLRSGQPRQPDGRAAERVPDKRLLKLIRAFLNAGILEDGLVSPTDEGTPQGAVCRLLFEPRAGRVRPRAGDAGSPLRPLRRRLQHLCAQPSGGRAGDAQPEPHS